MYVNDKNVYVLLSARKVHSAVYRAQQMFPVPKVFPPPLWKKEQRNGTHLCCFICITLQCFRAAESNAQNRWALFLGGGWCFPPGCCFQLPQSARWSLCAAEKCYSRLCWGLRNSMYLLWNGGDAQKGRGQTSLWYRTILTVSTLPKPLLHIFWFSGDGSQWHSLVQHLGVCPFRVPHWHIPYNLMLLRISCIMICIH